MRKQNRFSLRKPLNKEFKRVTDKYKQLLADFPLIENYWKQTPEAETGMTFYQTVMDDAFEALALGCLEATETELPDDLAALILSERDGIKINKDVAWSHLKTKINSIRRKGKEVRAAEIEEFFPIHWSALEELLGMGQKAVDDDIPPQQLVERIKAFGPQWKQVLDIIENEMVSDAVNHAEEFKTLATERFAEDFERATGSALPVNFDNDGTHDQAPISEYERLKKRYELKKETENIPEDIQKLIESDIRDFGYAGADNQDFVPKRQRLKAILDLPFGKYSHTARDLAEIEQELEESHFGLKDVKKSALQVIAMTNRRGPGTPPPGLLLVGPPGVGKTSIARSIAKAMNRQFYKMSLGGVGSERHIRGDYPVYMGSKHGEIIKAHIRTGTNDPVILLDEIDKLASSVAGEGKAEDALLEVTDPSQNTEFEDHHLGIPYDISAALFICTANDIDEIPAPLLDRIQIIEVEGYLTQDKITIAKQYLVKKAFEKTGLNEDEISFEDDLFEHLIQRYTDEAGVRNLSQKIEECCREVLRQRDTQKTSNDQIIIGKNNLHEFIGPPVYPLEKIPETDQVGYVNGLAWTMHGGCICTVEAERVQSQLNNTSEPTGSLGNVMKESYKVARNLISSMVEGGRLDKQYADKVDLIALHVPDGATPKDGPSAGAAITTALLSAVTGKPVKRDVAMTGEVNLRGEVGRIGGLTFKLEAAYLAGAKIVLIPQDNQNDLEKVPDYIKNELDIRPVKRIEEVLDVAIEPGLVAPPQSHESMARGDVSGPSEVTQNLSVTGLMENGVRASFTFTGPSIN